MDEPKRYQSQPIPSRDELDRMRNAPEERAGKGEEKAPWEIKFAEILSPRALMRSAVNMKSAQKNHLTV